jgi:hypothetical protein
MAPLLAEEQPAAYCHALSDHARGPDVLVAPPLIDTPCRSLQLAVFCAFTRRRLVTASNATHFSAAVFTSPMADGSLTIGRNSWPSD